MAKTSGISKSCGVYSIVNTHTGQMYIGSSYNLQKRFQRHLYMLRTNQHPNQHLQSAWNKYRESSFDFVILELCDKSIVRDREQVALETHSPEYNKNKLAVTNLGQKHTPQAREKISVAVRSWLDRGGDALRKKLSIAHSGSSPTQETRKKLSIAGKQFYNSQVGLDAKEKQRIKRNTTYTQEMRLQNGKKAAKTRKERGYIVSDSTKKKMRDKKLGRVLSAETKEKMSLTQKLRWEKIKEMKSATEN